MTRNQCTACKERPATREMLSGNPLCEPCFARFVGMAGGGAATAGGDNLGDAIITGVAAASYSGAVCAEGQRQREHAAKIEGTEGFFRRLWVRVVG